MHTADRALTSDAEQLVFAGSANAVADWAADYDDAVRAAIDEDHPCYLLYRLDSKNAYGVFDVCSL